MIVQNHTELLLMCAMNLGQCPVVFGILWLGLRDTAIYFASTAVIFGSQYCITHCHHALYTVQPVTGEPPEPIHIPAEELFELNI